MSNLTRKIPHKLIDSIQKSCVINLDQFEAAHQFQSAVSIRHNPFKKTNLFSKNNKVPWAIDAVYLDERIEFIKDPLFHAGCYYVQEASSMFLEQAIKQHIDLNKQNKLLDLCASPGGKSTLINSLLSEESLLVSNEVIRSRVAALSENLTKWGTCNHLVSNNDPADFNKLIDYFDAIVVDAPCSGSGLFRKQPDVILNWSESQVEHCSLRQKRILEDILPSLKANGILIYSTCSFSTEENEDIVNWLTKEHQLTSLQIELKNEWNICETETHQNNFGYRFFPHLTDGEGFFLAVLKKEEQKFETNSFSKKNQLKHEKKNEYELKTITSFLSQNNVNNIIKHNEYYFLVSQIIESELALLSQLKIRKKGTLIGSFKKTDFIPDHEFALSNYLNQEIPSIELNIEEALQFLKKSDIKPQQNLPKQFIKINYQNKTIGWAKNLGNRMNNYLPKDWRILKSIE